MRNLLLATLSLSGLAVGTSYGQAVVDPALRTAFASGPGLQQVVVTFKGSGAPTVTQVSLLRTLGITKGLTMQALPVAGVLATSAQVDALARNPEVRSVYFNKQLDYYNYDDTNLTGVKRLRADKTITARNNGTPVSGRGIGVLINDSGVDGTHEDIKLGVHLVQNTLGTTNLSNVSGGILPATPIEGVPNTDNNSGHGTHCTGTVGGNGARSNGKYEGVAPGAALLGYGSGAALLVLDAIGGFDYALTHQYQYNIRVISNSYGSSGTFDPNDPINVVTKKVYDRGIVVVFAAGNSGPGADTHNPYAIAPWTISVGAGDRAGQLAEFSSRGVKGQGGTFVVDGETWQYKNEPTITAPGVDVISTRVIGPVASLGAQTDANGELAPAEIPFYTHMSGTSMATPHLAGVCALILEAKPALAPVDVKALLQRTATNMPGRESWEAGAGYVNAYAAVDQALRNPGFGYSVNSARSFNASVNSYAAETPFQINYNPALTAANSFTFQVAAGATSLEAKITSGGVMGTTGNPTNLILLDPNGVKYSSGTPVAFALYPDRSVAVTSPLAGTWTLKVDGLRGVALPEDISGKLTVQTNTGTTNLKDIAGPYADAIKLAVSRRLVDGLPSGYQPAAALTRLQLADYLLMGQGIRQYLPTTGTFSFTDVSAPADVLLAEATTAKGAALRDRYQQYNGVMLPTTAGTFNPAGTVNRAALAYSLVQSLGFQAQAVARTGQPVTVMAGGQQVALDDAASIPAGLEGYVSIALELNLINAYYAVTQGPTDLQPTLHATFKPAQTVSRGEFAVIITRTFAQYDALTQPAATAARPAAAPATATSAAIVSKEVSAYPNPFSGSTTLSYYVEQEGPVSVEVYNVLGRKVRTLVQDTEAAGSHEVKLDASDLTQGTYLFTLKAGSTTTTKRLVVQ